MITSYSADGVTKGIKAAKTAISSTVAITVDTAASTVEATP